MVDGIKRLVDMAADNIAATAQANIAIGADPIKAISTASEGVKNLMGEFITAMVGRGSASDITSALAAHGDQAAITKKQKRTKPQNESVTA